MNKKEINYSLVKLDQAFKKLKAGASQAADELAEDGVIQRFEFTCQLLWKTIKVFLKNSGVIAMTPREVLQEAFRLEWFTDEKVFLNMLEDRNKTSHIYDQKTSREVFERIKNDYIPAIERVLLKLSSM
ncbi:MAG: HI0074 family nucleotidyltransferase substrate-binding subunit [bacterium]|nr:nucleotidyltransferase substrate binding protein [Candidatus Margulisiibacteriota bacterium]